jgi:hypothetical protein
VAASTSAPCARTGHGPAAMRVHYRARRRRRGAMEEPVLHWWHGAISGRGALPSGRDKLKRRKGERNKGRDIFGALPW